MKIIRGIVATACACALLVRVTRLVRAFRSDVVEYRVVEFAKSLYEGHGVLYTSADYAPALHRYVVIGGQAFREEYWQHLPFRPFKYDGPVSEGYKIFPRPGPEAFHKYPEWLLAVSALRTRIANGERPDAFVAVERVPL